MANGVKTYQLVINGITESIDAVESLNRQLEALEAKINELQGKTINIATNADINTPTVQTPSVSTGRESRYSELSDEDKLLKQIEATQSKINQADMADYKILLDKKNELKGLVKEQKSMTAEARLTENAYANTMQGMKEHLADIKAAMQTVDLGDVDTFQKLTKDANELNAKLLEIEKSYGQFGRNVGNYESAAGGFKNFKIEIDGVITEFDNARQAVKSLKAEMQTLSTKKDMNVISPEESERLKSLIPIVKQLESSIADAGKPMDALLDTMQSIIAIASASKGFAALFGLDNNKIEESIRKLVALQNVMQSIQTMQKQMQTGEGLFGMFSKANQSLEKFIVNAQSGTKAVQAMGKAASFTSKAIKGIGKAFGWIGVAMTAIEIITSLFEKTKQTADATKTFFEREKQYANAMGEAYGKGLAKITEANAKIQAFNGGIQEEKILVDELNKSLGNEFGNYKSIAEWKQALIDKQDDYLNMLETEIKMEMIRNEIAQKMARIRELESGQYAALHRQEIDELNRQLNALLGELTSVASTAEKMQDKIKKKELSGSTSTKYKKEVIDYESELQKIRLNLMEDGLNKRLMELEEEKRQTLNKFKGNYTAYLEAEKLYEEKRKNIIKEYNEEIRKSIDDSIKAISSDKYNNAINKLNIDSERKLINQPKNIGLLTEKEIQEADNGLKAVAHYYTKLEEAYEKHLITQEELFKSYDEGIKNLTEEQQAELAEIFESTDGDNIKKKEEYYKATSEMLKQESDLYKYYGLTDEKTLSGTIESRIETLRTYHDTVLKEVKNNLQERARIEKLHYVKIREDAAEAEKERWEKQEKELKEAIDSISKLYFEQEKIFKEKQGQLSEDEMKTYKEVEEKRLASLENMLLATSNHNQKMKNIEEEYNNNILKLENDTAAERNSIQTKYFDEQISNYRDFISKINNEIAKQPVYDSAGFGIINIPATKKNYKELLDATTKTSDEIQLERDKLSEAFNMGLLSPESYNAILKQLNDLDTSTKEQMDAITENSKGLLDDLVGLINKSIQIVGQSIQRIMDANNTYQDYLFDKQQEYLDKQNDILEDKLRKQEDILQKHSDKVNDIEDELSTARGDRRQHLIDQLNAEIAAEREAQAQKIQIEKQQEALQKKQDELDKARKKAEYERNLQSILVSGAMAISNAFATQPFVPVGIAMGVLATSLTAYQYMMAKKAKPYAKGGLLEGPSHKDGGIPVYGGRAELEGMEYVVNKKTTTQNLQLLEYINSTKKRIDLSDMIEFFNDKPRKTIASINGKFANGGVLSAPSVDVSSSFDRTIVVKDEGVYQVSVVDINRKQEQVKNIQVVAGIGK